MTHARSLDSLRVLWDSGTLSGLDDGPLLARFVERAPGAELAFGALVDRHGPMVLRVCERLLGDRHSAEDAFQAVFLVLARRAGSIRKPDRLGPWLYGVALRTAREARSREGRRRRRERPSSDPPPDLDAAPPPEQALARSEEAEAVLAEVDRLPDHYRSAVVLCDLQGLTQQEAAGRLRCPPGTVAVRLKRARERLRGRLERRGIGPSADWLAVVGGSSLPGPTPILIDLTTRAAMTGAPSAPVAALAKKVMIAMTWKKWQAALALTTLGVGLAATCTLAGGRPPQGPPRAAPPEVEIVRPVEREVRDASDFVGRVEVSRSVEVRARTGGFLLSAPVKEGDPVKRGDRLFEIDARAQKIAFEGANAAVAQAMARGDRAQLELNNTRRLAANKGVGQDEVHLYEAADHAARAAVEIAKADLDKASLDLAYMTIHAPADGKIAGPLAQPGDYIKAGETVLATIVVDDPMVIAFDLDERTFLKLAREARSRGSALRDLPFQVGLVDEDGFPRAARFASGGDRLDPATATARLRLAVDNADHLLVPGLFSRVRMTVGPPRKALLVPYTAICGEPNRVYVHVLDDQDAIRERVVARGRDQAGFAEILGGLTTDDRVVLKPIGEMPLGKVVKPRIVP